VPRLVLVLVPDHRRNHSGRDEHEHEHEHDRRRAGVDPDRIAYAYAYAYAYEITNHARRREARSGGHLAGIS
jgi:hypothetical protein